MYVTKWNWFEGNILIFKVQNIIIENIISLMVIWVFLGQLDYLLNFNELGNSILVA